jgi:hypothetical protein
LDVEVTIYGAPASSPPYLTLVALFQDDHPPLPRNPRRLYNALKGLWADDVQPCLFPDYEEKKIRVLGVEARLYLEGLSGRLLHDTLDRLVVSHGILWDCLTEGEGPDHWAEDGTR